MNIKVLVLIIGFFCGGCSQKKEVTMITQNPHITANNIVEEINKEVKHYNSEKNFMISYENYNCYFEVFVNDIPCYRYFKEPASSSAFDLNQCIFKNGIQKVTYKMYPATDDNAEIKNFTESTYLKLKVESYDKKNKNAEDILYQDYKTPEVDGIDQYGHKNKIFIAKGKTYYEGSFTFEATVPYQLQGFDKMQDLRKMDKKVLEQKLLAKYQEVWQVYNNKQYDDIARISYENLRDQFIAKYDEKDYINKVWEMLMEIYKQPTFEMQPLKDYKLVFLADGKFVALMQTNLDRRVRGNTALWAKVDYDGGIRPQFCNRYFYIPEGETEFKVY